MISEFELDDALTFFKLLNEIDASLQKLLIGNQKCDTGNSDDDDDDADGVMIPKCRPCFASDTKISTSIFIPLSPPQFFVFWNPQENRTPKKIGQS